MGVNRVNRFRATMPAASLVLALVLSACSPEGLANLARRPQALPTISADLPQDIQGALRDFDIAVAALSSEYYNSSAVSTQWKSVADAQRKKIIDSNDPRQLADSLRGTIDALGPNNDVQMVLSASPSLTRPLGTIGVVIDPPSTGKDRALVLAVLPNSPAERAGLRAHDSIVDIDGRQVTGDEGATVMRRITGEPDTRVTLTVETPGKEAREVTLTRRLAQPDRNATQVEARLIGDTRIAYIAPQPMLSAERMRESIGDALRTVAGEDRLDGIVLDLRTMRDFDFPIDKMLSLFVSGDQLGTVEDRADLSIRPARTPVAIVGKSIRGSQDVPMAVLVSELTQGPAESFAGLLQDLGRARVVGVKTPGRTAVMGSVQLPTTRAVLLIPTGEYVGSKGARWFGKGVTPDVLVDTRFEDYNADSDTQLDRAVEAVRR
jgi:carboxyl-terminal processing protease